MRNDDYSVELDQLTVGLTRSPVFMGVTIRMFFANLVLNVLICIDAHTILGVPLFMALHLIMVRLSVKDPEFAYVYFKSLLKTPPVLNRWYWGKINSYEPW